MVRCCLPACYVFVILLGTCSSVRTLLEFPGATGAWKYGPTRQLAYEEIGRCYDPSHPWGVGQMPDGGTEWEADFGKSIESAPRGPAFPHPQVLNQPIERLRFVKHLAPKHQSVALTSDWQMHVPEGQWYADSHCFTFNYSNLQDGDADRHGCWFFRRSFQRLQTLRQCIVAELDASKAWGKYMEIAGKIKAGDINGSEPLVDGTGTATEMGEPMDSIRHADEIIKSVGFKNWETWGEGIKQEIERKISRTVITKTRKSVLEPATITSIRHSCFLVDDDRADELSAEAVILKRSLPCYQLMWDVGEVAGAPHQPTNNAITGIGRTTKVEKDFAVPPVCARAAMSLVAEKLKRAPEGYRATACIKSCPSWRECTDPKNFNCRCLACCWKKALRRICEINSGCCDPSMTTAQG